jgi:hypothetical protein
MHGWRQETTIRRSFLALLCCLASTSANAAEPKVDFARDIQPILSHHCSSCHGPDEKARKAELRLDVRDSALARKAVVPGNLKASKLAARIDSTDETERMPPADTKKPLSAQQKQLLKTWIEQGANYAQHWAFLSPRRPATPQVNNTSWSRNGIDPFVLQRLEREGLKPSPEADKATLIRRVTLDLTGLPPTLQELDNFLADTSPNAYEKVVDRLLASPRYAERMAMAWLDAARYADTNGFNNDEDRTQWPWRDWVIDAFQHNMPYDQFIVEQLAGDLLPNPTVSQRIATGFHRNQVHNTEGGIIAEEYRVEYVADRVHTTATIFLGLSMQCARCHDHKFDPITQREYYQFFAYFNNLSDKQASYSNFVGAEPFIRAPSKDQQSKLDKLEHRRAEREKQIQKYESEADAHVAKWEKSLTQEEIQKLGNVGFVLHLPLDETKGEAVHSGDGAQRGTVRGKAKWTAGKTGSALEFDGNTFVEVSQAPNFDSDGPFSISLWTFPISNEGGALISKMDDGNAYRGYDVLLESGKIAVHVIHHWPDNAIKIVTKKAVALNSWHNVVVTYDGSRKAAGVKVYVDGKLEPADISNDSLRGTIITDKPLHLGKRQATLTFKGKLDDVKLFGVELNPEQVSQLAAGQPVNLVSNVLAIPPEKRTSVEKTQVRRFYLERIDKDYSRLRNERDEATRQKQELEKGFPVVMVMQELPTPRETFILKRGQYDAHGEKVIAGVPAILPRLPDNAPKNRLALANWLVSPAHPLTARVAVNRWWQMIFGTGLVKTVEDFGLTGELPSHPELLDHLAVELVQNRWDVRATIKLMVMSATYRQSSRLTQELRERDPENRLLARGSRYRLPAELVRDNALAISGLLKESIGGASVKPYQPSGLWEDVTVSRRGVYVAEKGDNLYRRGMYTFWKRTCPPPALMSFDAPNREVCVARRATTNTPLQALILLNDPTYVEAARKFAERVLLEGGKTAETRLAFAFRCAVSRTPSPDEERIALGIYQNSLKRFQADKEAAKKLLAVGDSPRDKTLDETELAAWTTVTSTILNLDETISKR